jgi:phage repressor protein C with HTH and peptisase S24 domain
MTDRDRWPERLRHAMTHAGLRPVDLARRAGISDTLLSHYLAGVRKNPRGDALERLADACGVSRLWLIAGAGAMLPNAPEVPATIGGVDHTVPVFGAAAGAWSGAAADFTKPVDHAARPGGAADPGLYALWVAGDSMAPRYVHGDLIFVSPSRPVRVGDFAVIEQTNAKGAELWVKRVVGLTADHVEAEQYTPAARQRFLRGQITRLHHVLTTAELAGL